MNTPMPTHLRSVLFVFCAVALLLHVPATFACSRATWLGKDGTAITGDLEQFETVCGNTGQAHGLVLFV